MASVNGGLNSSSTPPAIRRPRSPDCRLLRLWCRSRQLWSRSRRRGLGRGCGRLPLQRWCPLRLPWCQRRRLVVSVASPPPQAAMTRVKTARSPNKELRGRVFIRPPLQHEERPPYEAGTPGPRSVRLAGLTHVGGTRPTGRIDLRRDRIVRPSARHSKCRRGLPPSRGFESHSLRQALLRPGTLSQRSVPSILGGMAERSKAAVLKTAGPIRVPWVRIPLPPLPNDGRRQTADGSQKSPRRFSGEIDRW